MDILGDKMKYRPADTVHIETTYNVLRSSILTALERDNSKNDIVDEILRILSIRVNKRNNHAIWVQNFNSNNTPIHKIRLFQSEMGSRRAFSSKR